MVMTVGLPMPGRDADDVITQQAITLEDIYRIMVNFDCVYKINE